MVAVLTTYYLLLATCYSPPWPTGRCGSSSRRLPRRGLLQTYGKVCCSNYVPGLQPYMPRLQPYMPRLQPYVPRLQPYVLAFHREEDEGVRGRGGPPAGREVGISQRLRHACNRM